MDLATLRSDLRLYLGLDDINLPNIDADRLLNQSLLEIDNKFPFREKELIYEFVTVQGVYSYAIVQDAFESLRTISILAPDAELDAGQWTDLERMTATHLGNVQNDIITNQARPCEYLRENANILLWPTPDAIYTIRVRYLCLIAQLVNAGDIPGFPENWHEILLYGACWRGFLKIGDMERVTQFKNQQVALITSTVPVESKEEMDTHFGGAEVYGREGYYRRPTGRGRRN